MDLKNTPGDDKVFLIRRKKHGAADKKENKEERESQMKKIFQMKEPSQKKQGRRMGKSYASGKMTGS